MSDATLILAIIVGFVGFFAALWLLITTLLLKMAGWGSLSERFPDRSDETRKRFALQTGAIGPHPLASVNFKLCLTMEVCEAGLRITIMKLLAPFAEPIFIPWDELAVEKRKFLGFAYYDLLFGGEGEGHMLISKRLGRRISEASEGALKLPE